MSSKHRLLFPSIFVVLLVGWLVGAVALAASPVRRCRRHCTTSSSSSTTTTPTTSTTSTTSTTTTSSTTTAPGPQPVSGLAHPGGGAWSLAFDDEFNGTSLNTAVWGYYPGGSNTGPELNNLASDPSLVTVSGGYLNLAVSGSEGGMVASGWAEDFSITTTEGPARGYALPVGGYVEARIKFEGSGSTINGWPAFWASRRLSWPQSGEFDIAEGYDGLLGPGYWQGTSPATAFGQSGPKASFAAAGTFHTYGVYRSAGNMAYFYYDGVLQWSEPTDDDGMPASLILMTGAGDTNGVNAQPQPNASGISMQVDYVRAWQ